MRKLLVGLTGGVGSGKSTVANMLALQGAAIIDVDQAGRWAVEENPDVREKIRAVFGNEMFFASDKLDRRRLGALIFADSVAREKLNKIVHPVMIARVRDLIQKTQQDVDTPYIVVDAALIFELGLDNKLDLTIVVNAPLEQCRQRVQKRDGLSEEAIRQRMAAQLPIKEKLRRADFVVENDDSLATLEKRAKQVHDWLLQKRHEMSSGTDLSNR
jgi:dephospho-CoA kinase